MVCVSVSVYDDSCEMSRPMYSDKHSVRMVVVRKGGEGLWGHGGMEISYLHFQQATEELLQTVQPQHAEIDMVSNRSHAHTGGCRPQGICSQTGLQKDPTSYCTAGLLRAEGARKAVGARLLAPRVST